MILERILRYGRSLFTLSHRVDRNEADLRQLEQDLKGLAEVISSIILELRRQDHEAAHDREMQALRLENELLKFERRLPREPE